MRLDEIGRVGKVDKENGFGYVITEDKFVKFNKYTLYTNTVFENLNVGNIVLCSYIINDNVYVATEIVYIDPLIIVK